MKKSYLLALVALATLFVASGDAQAQYYPRYRSSGSSYEYGYYYQYGYYTPPAPTYYPPPTTYYVPTPVYVPVPTPVYVAPAAPAEPLGHAVTVTKWHDGSRFESGGYAFRLESGSPYAPPDGRWADSIWVVRSWYGGDSKLRYRDAADRVYVRE